MSQVLGLFRRSAALAGWSGLAIVLFATLSPIGLRPNLVEGHADVERFLAFFMVACSLSLAYPRHRLPILIATTTLAIALEAGQFIVETRHGRPHDALVKIVGCLIGVGLSLVIERALAPALRRSRA